MQSNPPGGLRVRLSKHPDVVPEAARKYPMELSIAARNLPRTVRMLSRGKFYAVVQIRHAGKSDFETLFTTERRSLETFPSFTQKGWLGALKMPNSSQVASKTAVRAELFAGRSSLGAVETTLSALLWRTAPTPKLQATEQDRNFRRLSRPNGQHIPPEIALNLEAYYCPPQASPEYAKNVHIAASISDILQRSTRDFTLAYSVARATSLGGWTTLFHSGKGVSGKQRQMEDAKLPRHFVLGGDENRQLRFALHSFHCSSGGRMEGFVITRLGELRNMQKNGGGRAANLAWTCKEDGNLNGRVEFRSLRGLKDGSVSLYLHFKDEREVHAEQVAVAAETGASRMVAGKVGRLTLRRGNSSVSSDSESASTFTSVSSGSKDGKDVHAASEEGRVSNKSAAATATVDSSPSDFRSSSNCTGSTSDSNVGDAVHLHHTASAVCLPLKPPLLSTSRRAFEMQPLARTLPVVEMEVRFPGE